MPFLYDEKDCLTFAQNYLETGDFIYRDEITELNNRFDYPVTSVTYSVWNDDIKGSVPLRAIGNYFLLAFSLIAFGSKLQFFYVLLFLGSAFFFAYLSAEIHRGIQTKSRAGSQYKKIFALASLLFIFFPPFLLWANTYYDTIPGAFFFIGGILFSFKGKERSETLYYILGAVNFGIASLMRFEYILFCTGALLLFAIYFKETKMSHRMIQIGIYNAFILFLLVMNCHLYGSPFTIGYSQKNHVVNFFNAGNLQDVQGTDLDLVSKIIYVYLFTFFNPSLDILANNIINFLLLPFAGYLCVSLLCIPSLVKRYKIPMSIFSIPLIAWGYYIFTGTFWGMNHPSWLINCYYRYSYPLFIVMLLLTSISVGILMNKKELIKKILVCCFISIIIICSPLTLMTSDYGLNEVIQEKKLAKDVNTDIADIVKPNSLILAPFFEKYITDRNIISPWYIAEGKEKKVELILGYTEQLLQDHYRIYYICADWHDSTYLGLDIAYQKDDRFNLTLIKEHKDYSLYQIERNRYRSSQPEDLFMQSSQKDLQTFATP